MKEELFDFARFYMYEKNHYQHSDDIIWQKWNESNNSDKPSEAEPIGKHEQKENICLNTSCLYHNWALDKCDKNATKTCDKRQI